MIEKEYLYDSLVKSAIRLAATILSYYFGAFTLFFISPSETFFRTTLIFAIGFTYEFGCVITDHLKKRTLFCRRIRIEASIGFLSGISTTTVCFIKIAERSVLVNDMPGWIVFIFTSVFLVIIGMETGFGLKQLFHDEKEISLDAT